MLDESLYMWNPVHFSEMFPEKNDWLNPEKGCNYPGNRQARRHERPSARLHGLARWSMVRPRRSRYILAARSALEGDIFDLRARHHLLHQLCAGDMGDTGLKSWRALSADSVRLSEFRFVDPR